MAAEAAVGVVDVDVVDEVDWALLGVSDVCVSFAGADAADVVRWCVGVWAQEQTL